jgi:hypothetical protein
LPPLRLRFTLLGLILVVAIAALLFSVGAEAIRLHTISSYHAIETQKAANNRPPGPPFGHTSLEDWHFRMANDYRAAGDHKEAILGVMVKAFVMLGMVAALGRVIHWLFRRPALSSREWPCSDCLDETWFSALFLSVCYGMAKTPEIGVEQARKLIASIRTTYAVKAKGQKPQEVVKQEARLNIGPVVFRFPVPFRFPRRRVERSVEYRTRPAFPSPG